MYGFFTDLANVFESSRISKGQVVVLVTLSVSMQSRIVRSIEVQFN